MTASDSRQYDVVIVGGGHNALVSAAYLARAGRRVAVIERADAVGGAAVSERPWRGVDARLSRYSYLVSLLPQQIIDDLGLRLELRRRRYSSYTPDPTDPTRGILGVDEDATGRVVRVGRVRRVATPTQVDAQPQIVDDLLRQETDEVRVAREAGIDPGPRALRHGGTAHGIRSLDHHHAAPGAGEIGRGDEGVVPSSHDDDVVPASIRSGHASTLTTATTSAEGVAQ